MTHLPLAFLLSVTPAPAPSAMATQLRDEALKGTHAADRVKSLTDQAGPRLAGSPGAARAVEWALAHLHDAGLENVHAEPVRVPQWVRGVESAEIAGAHPQRLVVTALGNSIGTRPEGLTAQVVRTESLDTLKALLAQTPDAVRGKIVFFDRRFERTQDFRGYGEDVGMRSAGPGLASKAGAVGVLIRSVGSNLDRVPHTGVTNYGDSAPIPAAALPAPDADFLDRRIADDAHLAVHLTLGCATLPDADGFNVVGDVRGREKPDEVVVLGAHLDSWDLGQGAVDDGAGVGIVVETAARLAKLRPHLRRTVRVVLYANEENGAKGAQAYRDAHRAELDHCVAAMESDSGQDPAFSFHALAGPEAPPLLATMAELLQPLGIASTPGDEFGVDVGFLREGGVPLLNLDQDVSAYFDLHHSPDDTFDKIIPAHLDRVVAAYLVVTTLAAESNETLGRIPEAQRARPKK